MSALIPYYKFLNYTNDELHKGLFVGGIFDGRSFPVSIFADKKIYFNDDVFANFLIIISKRSQSTEAYFDDDITKDINWNLFVNPQNINVVVERIDGVYFSEVETFLIESRKLTFLLDLSLIGFGNYRLRAWWMADTFETADSYQKLEYNFSKIDATSNDDPNAKIPIDGIDIIADENLPSEIGNYNGTWPITTGVPLSIDDVYDITKLALYEENPLDGSYVPIQVQIDPIAYWHLGTHDKPSSIKWILIHFNLKYDNSVPRKYKLKKTDHIVFPEDNSQIYIHENSERIIIQNNKIKISVSKDKTKFWTGINEAWYDVGRQGRFNDETLEMQNQEGPFLKFKPEGGINDHEYKAILNDIQIEAEGPVEIPKQLLDEPVIIENRGQHVTADNYYIDDNGKELRKFQIDPLLFDRINYHDYITKQTTPSSHRGVEHNLLNPSDLLPIGVTEFVHGSQLRKVKVTLVAKGKYVLNNGDVPDLTKSVCRFVTRITVYRDNPSVKISHRTIIDYDMRGSSGAWGLSNLGWGFCLKKAWLSWLAAGEGASELALADNFTNLSLHHYKSNKLRVIQDGHTVGAAAVHTYGWAALLSEAACLSVFVKDFWQKFPQEIEIENIRPDGILRLHFWPKNGDLRGSGFENELSLDNQLALENIYKLDYLHTGKYLDFRMPQSYIDKLNFLARNNYDGYSQLEYIYDWNHDGEDGGSNDNLINALNTSSKGLCISNDFTLLFHSGSVSKAELNQYAKINQYGPHARSSAEHNVRTKTEGNIAAKDESVFPIAEAVLEESQNLYSNIINDNDEYGRWIYADIHDDWLIEKSFISEGELKLNGLPVLKREWTGSHYRNVFTPWFLYLRGGSHKMLNWARVNTQHFMDVSTVNSDDGNELLTNDFKPAGSYFHCHSFIPYGNNANGMHWANPDALLYSYLITGDLNAKENYEIWIASIFRTSLSSSDAGRNASNVLGEIVNGYQYSFDPTLLFYLNLVFDCPTIIPVINIPYRQERNDKKGIAIGNSNGLLQRFNFNYEEHFGFDDNWASFGWANWHHQLFTRFYNLTRDSKIVTFAFEYINYVNKVGYNNEKFYYDYALCEGALAFLITLPKSAHTLVKHVFKKVAGYFFNRVKAHYLGDGKYKGVGVSKYANESVWLQDVPYFMYALKNNATLISEANYETHIDVNPSLSVYPFIVSDGNRATPDNENYSHPDSLMIYVMNSSDSSLNLDLGFTFFRGKNDHPQVGAPFNYAIMSLPSSPEWEDITQEASTKDLPYTIAADSITKCKVRSKDHYIPLYAPLNQNLFQEILVLKAFYSDINNANLLSPTKWILYSHTQLKLDYDHAVSERRFNVILEFQSFSRDNFKGTSLYPASIALKDKDGNTIPNIGGLNKDLHYILFDPESTNGKVSFELNPDGCPYTLEMWSEYACYMLIKPKTDIADLKKSFYLISYLKTGPVPDSSFIRDVYTDMNSQYSPAAAEIFSELRVAIGSCYRYIDSRGYLAVLIRFNIDLEHDFGFNRLIIRLKNSDTDPGIIIPGQYLKTGFQTIEFISDDKIDSPLLLPFFDGVTLTNENIPIKDGEKLIVAYPANDPLQYIEGYNSDGSPIKKGKVCLQLLGVSLQVVSIL